MEQENEMTNTVDLTPMLEAYTKDATKEFFENLAESNIMEMSFDRGEILKVKVLGEAAESTPTDIKYDVEIIEVIHTPELHKFHTPYHKHQVGCTRWVRVYNLKKAGHYQEKGWL